MRRTKLPVVNERCLEDIEKNLVLAVGSNEWYDWLKTARNFRFIPMQHGWTLIYEFTANKRSSGYWYGYRRVNGKLRQTYLGKSINIDFDALQDAATRLSLGDVEYWKMRTQKKKSMQNNV